MALITGLPETYYVGHQDAMSKISTGLGGQATVIVSSKNDSNTYEVSIWLNRFGMVCIGCEQFEISGGRDSTIHPSLDIVWHPLGTHVVVMVHGEIVFIQLYWLDKKSKVKISARDATIRTSVGESQSHQPNSLDENQVVVRLIEQNRHSLRATTLSLGDGGRWLLVGSDHSMMYKLSWRGYVTGTISLQPATSHEVFETWQSSSNFTLSPATMAIPTATNCYQMQVRKEKLDEEDGGIHQRHIEVVGVGEYNENLRLSPMVLADGSIAFLHLTPVDKSSSTTTTTSDRGTDKKSNKSTNMSPSSPAPAYLSASIHPVALIKLARAKTADATSPVILRMTGSNNNRRGQLETVVVTDAHGDATKYFGAVNSHNTSGSSVDKDINRLLKRGVFQPAVSRVVDLCLVEENNEGCQDNHATAGGIVSALLVVKVMTKHLLPMEMESRPGRSASAINRDVSVYDDLEEDDDNDGDHDGDDDDDDLVVPRNEGKDGSGREGTSGGSGRGRRETMTLSVIRISWQQNPSNVTVTVDQEGGTGTGTGMETLGTITKSDAGMILSLQHVSTICLPQPVGNAGRARGVSTGSTPSLVLLRGYQSPPRLLVVIDGTITCRPLSDLSCVLFRMDALGGGYNAPLMYTPTIPPPPPSTTTATVLQVSPPTSPVMSPPPRVCVQVVVGFGRLLVSVCAGGGGGVSGPHPLDPLSPSAATSLSVSVSSHRRPKVHVVPLLYLAAGTGGVETGSTPNPLPPSPIPPQQAHAKGVLIDPCEHRLLLLSSRGHKSNSFSPLPLPASIVEQWRAQAFSASLARARTLRLTNPQRGVGVGVGIGGDTRPLSGGHDVSIEPHHTHAGPLVALSAAVEGSGARRGYLAVVMGDQSGAPPPDVPLPSHTTTHYVAPTLPPTDLWLYNLSTHRWRSTDLSIPTALLLLRSGNGGAKNNRRLSYSDSNPHPQMTQLSESKRRPSAPPAHTTTTPTLSRGNSLATQSAEGWPATLDTPHPLTPSIDDCDVVSVMSDHTLPHPHPTGQGTLPTAHYGPNRSNLYPSQLPPRQPFSASGNVSSSAGIATAGAGTSSSSSNLSQPSVLAVAWFGEHTVVLLTRRIVALVGSASRGGEGEDQGDNDRSKPSSPQTHATAGATHPNALTPYNFYLEVLSRAPTKQSLRAGRPRPAVHRVVPLPVPLPLSPGLGLMPTNRQPSSSAFTHTSMFVPRTIDLHADHDDSAPSTGRPSSPRCTVVVGDGIGQYLAYSVITTTTTTTSTSADNHQHDATSGGLDHELLDYAVSPMWACDVSRLRMASSQDTQGSGLAAGAGGGMRRSGSGTSVSSAARGQGLGGGRPPAPTPTAATAAASIRLKQSLSQEMLTAGLSHPQVTRIELPLRAMMVVPATSVITTVTSGSGESNNGGMGLGMGVGMLVVDRVGKACYVNPLHVHAPGVTGTAAAAATTGAITSTLADDTPLTRGSFVILHEGPFSSLSDMGHMDFFRTAGRPGLADKGQGPGFITSTKEPSMLAFGRAVMFHGTPMVPTEKKETKTTAGKTGGMGGFSFWGGGGSRPNSAIEEGGGVKGVGGLGDGIAVDMLWIPKREHGVSCTVPLSPTPGSGLVTDRDEWEEEQEPGASSLSSHQYACPPALMFTFPAAVTDTSSVSSPSSHSLSYCQNIDGSGAIGASGVPVGVVHGATMSLIPRFTEMYPLVLALVPGGSDSVGQHSPSQQQQQQQQQQALHRQQQASLMIPGGGVQVTVRHPSLPYLAFLGLVRIACGNSPSGVASSSNNRIINPPPGNNTTPSGSTSSSPSSSSCVDADEALELIRRLLATLQQSPSDERRSALTNPNSPTTPNTPYSPLGVIKKKDISGSSLGSVSAPPSTSALAMQFGGGSSGSRSTTGPSPIAQQMFLDCLEMRLKQLVESPIFSSHLKQSEERRIYRDIVSVLAHCDAPDAPMLCEVLSRLGRKLEPSVSHRLFPVILTTPGANQATDGHGWRPVQLSRSPMEPPSFSMVALNTNRASSSSSSGGVDTSGASGTIIRARLTPLVLFEHALATRQLARAARLLTLACEYIGGSTSAACASRSLEMALELLYETLRCLSLTHAAACLEFCCRLQEMAVAAAGGSIGNPEGGFHAIRSRRKHSIPLPQGSAPGPGLGQGLIHPPLAVTSEPAFDGAEDLPTSTAVLSTVSYDEHTTPTPNPIPTPNTMITSPIATTGNTGAGVKTNPQSNPRTQPLAPVSRPPKPPVSPDLQLTCTDNRVWRGVGGGLFSSLASVSPALSYYLGGTAVWAVQQTWRAISDQPPSDPSSYHSTGPTPPSGQEDHQSTYQYHAFALALAAGKGGNSASSSSSSSNSKNGTTSSGSGGDVSNAATNTSPIISADNSDPPPPPTPPMHTPIPTTEMHDNHRTQAPSPSNVPAPTSGPNPSPGPGPVPSVAPVSTLPSSPPAAVLVATLCADLLRAGRYHCLGAIVGVLLGSTNADSGSGSAGWEMLRAYALGRCIRGERMSEMSTTFFESSVNKDKGLDKGSKEDKGQLGESQGERQSQDNDHDKSTMPLLPSETIQASTIIQSTTTTETTLFATASGSSPVTAISLEETLMDIAKAFRLHKLILPPPRTDWLGKPTSPINASTPGAVLARNPSLAALVKQLVDATSHNENPPPTSPLPTVPTSVVTLSEALTLKLAQPLLLSQLRIKCEREMFALYPQQRSALTPSSVGSGSGTKGGVMGGRVGGVEGKVSEVGGGRYDEEYVAGGGVGGGGGVQASLVASDVVHVSLAEPLDVVGGAHHRILPRAMFAASHVDVDVTVGADADHLTGAITTSGGPTVGGLVRRIGAALLLVGRVQEAAVVAAALLGRYDIAAACRDILPAAPSPLHPSPSIVSGIPHDITNAAEIPQVHHPIMAAQAIENALRARVDAFDKALQFFTDGS